MKAPVKIGNTLLYHSDNKAIIPLLPNVDVVITDPPYSPKTHRNSRSNKTGADVPHITFDSLTESEFLESIELLLQKAKSWVVLTCDYRHAALLYDHPSFIRIGAWIKTNPMPQISGDRPGQGFEAVAILHSGKIKKKWNRGGGAGVWTSNTVGKALVPTQKPLSLYKEFFADFSNKGDIVLDPFMGAGTSGVAAIHMGRRYIGIEADQARFDIAVSQIQATYDSLALFHMHCPNIREEVLSLGI